MIENFENIKKQLSELSTIINSFKSESVQLKIIELIFSNKHSIATTHSPELQHQKQKPPYKRKARKNKNDENKSPKSISRKTGKKGAATLLNELIAEGYFTSKKSLSEIVSYCSTKKATTVKPGDFSTKLTRFVRDEKLKREQNSEGQYEYFTK